MLAALTRNLARVAARSNNSMTSLAAAATRSATFTSSSTAFRRGAATGAARVLTPQSSTSSMMLRTVRLPSPSSSSSSSRGFFASAASAAPSSSASSSSLLSILDTEIRYEAEHAPEGPPALPEGWTFDSGGDGSKATGSARLTLRATSAPAGERVVIDLLVDDQVEEDDEDFGGLDDEDADVDDEDGGGGAGFDAGIVFTVSVSKDSSPYSSLVFDCRSDGTYLLVMHVSLERKENGGDGDDDDGAEFSGPHFDELDEALQAEFEGYLEERGVSPSLGGALAALAEDKEAREYAAWLARVRDFVAAR